MKLDTPIRPTIADHIEIETEGDRVFQQAVEQLDQARFAKVMRMTARAFGELSEVEKRNYTRWAKGFARTFAEKAAMFERNSRPEPELPAVLQAGG